MCLRAEIIVVISCLYLHVFLNFHNPRIVMHLRRRESFWRQSSWAELEDPSSCCDQPAQLESILGQNPSVFFIIVALPLSH